MDGASMSLDEYIKKKKIKRPGVGAGPQKKGQGKRKAKGASLAIRARGNQKWNMKSRNAGRGNVKRRANQVARKSSYSFSDKRNALARANYKQGSFGFRKRKQEKAGGSGSQISISLRRQLLKQLQTSRNVMSGRKVNVRNQSPKKRQNTQRKSNAGMVGKTNKFRFQRKAKNTAVLMAQKRLNKARNLLATRRKILGQNKAATSTVSGRIRFSKFGLRTTRRANYVETMVTMQDKIQRAQLARNRFFQQISPILEGNAPRNRPAAFRPRKPQRSLFEEPRFYSGPASGSLYSDRLFGGSRGSGQSNSNRRRAAYDENWINTPRRVVNTEYAGGLGVFQRQVGSSHALRSLQELQPRHEQLDPEIQNRISFIQDQGRRNRGDMDDYISPDFRPVVSSRMSIGDRFRRLMK